MIKDKRKKIKGMIKDKSSKRCTELAEVEKDKSGHLTSRQKIKGAR